VKKDLCAIRLYKMLCLETYRFLERQRSVYPNLSEKDTQTLLGAEYQACVMLSHTTTKESTFLAFGRWYNTIYQFLSRLFWRYCLNQSL